ncbi:MAG: ABC transporter permease, partial [Candidatus Acidiferrales bacterium]
MNAASQTSAATQVPMAASPPVPVLRITPPTRWWVVPVAELWQARELIYFFVWRDIKIRYKQTAVGAAWAVLQPLLAMTVFTLFFGKLAHIPSEGLPYQVFVLAGLLPWMYFAASLANATNTIVENQRVITKVYFPRLVLPLSAVLSGLVDFGISFVIFAIMMVYYHLRPTMQILWLPAFLLLAMLTALGVGLWLSALNAIYRDVRYVLPFLIQLWLFASPVIYPPSLMSAKWRWLFGLNPMAGVIEGFRWSLAGQGDPPIHLILVSTGIVLALLLSGLAYFQKMET